MFKTYVSTILCSIRIFFIEKKEARTPEWCLVEFKMCHSKSCHEMRPIVAAILDEKSNFFGVNPFVYTF